MPGPQRIDLRKIVAARWKHFPMPVAAMLEKIIHQRELNEMLQFGYPYEGHTFAEKVYEYLGLSIESEGLDDIPDGRYVFASNHPLGGLDGIGLVLLLGRRYGDDNIRVLVNDMLMHVDPFRNVFLPVNKFGAQGRGAARAINDAYASERQVVMFPAGLVSRLHADGVIRDLEWQKSFVAKALEYGRQIVPVRFEALNRRRFYRLAHWRRKLRIGFNIEQIFLPAEVCAARGKAFRVRFLDPVDPAELKARGLSAQEIAARIRASLYD